MKLKTLTLPLTVAETDLDNWARTVLALQSKPRRPGMKDVRTLAASRILKNNTQIEKRKAS